MFIFTMDYANFFKCNKESFGWRVTPETQFFVGISRNQQWNSSYISLVTLKPEMRDIVFTRPDAQYKCTANCSHQYNKTVKSPNGEKCTGCCF